MPITKSMLEKIKIVTDAAPSLKKGERNEGAGFNFVGIDVFYEKVARMANDVGLNWVNVEEGIEIIPFPDQVIVLQKFRLDLLDTETGDVAEGFFRLTIPAPFSDAQTAGISLSYFDKAFMRSTFKVVTGEKDADHMARPRDKAPSKKQEPRQAVSPIPKVEKVDEKPAESAEPSEQKPKGKPGRPKKEEQPASNEWEIIADRLIERIEECESSSDLAQFRIDEQGDINKLKAASETSEAAAAARKRCQDKFSEYFEKYSEEEDNGDDEEEGEE